MSDTVEQLNIQARHNLVMSGTQLPYLESLIKQVKHQMDVGDYEGAFNMALDATINVSKVSAWLATASREIKYLQKLRDEGLLDDDDDTPEIEPVVDNIRCG